MTALLVAQLVTLAVLDVSGASVSSKDYALECLQPKVVETLPMVNPNWWYADDPADKSKDCRAWIAEQVGSLSPGSGYRIAVVIDGLYLSLSSPFSVVDITTPPPPSKSCIYLGVEYQAPYSLESELQFRQNTAAINVSAMKDAGWTMKQTRSNKQWQWWRASCES